MEASDGLKDNVTKSKVNIDDSSNSYQYDDYEMHKLSISEDFENTEVFSPSYMKDLEYNIEDEGNPSDNGIVHKEKDKNHFLTHNVRKVSSPHESKDSKEHKSFQLLRHMIKPHQFYLKLLHKTT